MTDQGNPARTQSYLASSSLSTASQSAVRPRIRRLENADEAHPNSTTTSNTSTSRTSYLTQSAGDKNTNNSSIPKGSRVDSVSNKAPTGGELGQFLGDSWTQSWTSVQAFASALISGNEGYSKGIESPQSRQRPRAGSRPDTWGPSPPGRVRAIDDVGVGSLAKRQDALRAAKTASILESHEGVNGGLDITGKHKRRTSDEIVSIDQQPEEHLVYVHNVELNDTYAGIILRYKCREDVFRKSNGLWSRDSVQTRKWLIIPVDACEIKGRPCNPPSWQNNCEADLLAPSPSAAGESPSFNEPPRNDFVTVDPTDTDAKQGDAEDMPWTHVRWVQIDSFRQPVRIARVARQALGYFPPRRKKSIRTVSPLSTPRQSSDLSSIPPNSIERPSSRRLSSLSGRPPISGTPMSSRSRVGSEVTDSRPTWMRRPGGVGSMGRSVRAPGPDKDYFNSWTRKHIPGLNIEGLPSMSVMGSETAHFGFGQGSTSIVESPFEDGRDATATSRQGTGTGLDRAAAAVEHWLRGALAKRPSTPLLGGRLRPPGMLADGDVTDLIELTDTASEDGKAPHDIPTSIMGTLSSGTIGRVESTTGLKGRTKNTTEEGRGAHKKDD